MRLRKRHRQATFGFNMTPLIDIVFLLIIFFMTVSHITSIVDSPIQLPEVQVADEPTAVIAITVNLQADGTAIIGGQHMSVDEAVVQVVHQKAEAEQANQAISILLRCDRQAPTRYVNQLTRGLASHQIYNIRVSVEAP